MAPGCIEINLPGEAIYQRYGHDLRSCVHASIERRTRPFPANTPLSSVTALVSENDPPEANGVVTMKAK